MPQSSWYFRMDPPALAMLHSSAAMAFGREAYYRMNNMNLEGALNYSKVAMLGILYTEDAKAWAYSKINGTVPELKNM